MHRSRLDRRLFLASLGSAGMLAACGGGHSSTLPLVGAKRSPLTGGTTLTFDLTQTDLPATTPVYAYIVGLVSAAHDTYYRIDSSGTVHVMQETDNVSGSAGATPGGYSALAANYPTDWADYSIPLKAGSTTTVSLAGINTASMPELGTGTAAFSGRIFISVGMAKLPITPTGSGPVAGGASGATGWTAPVFTIPPGHLTMYDWIEFSFDSRAYFDANTTQVNQFGFPLGLTASPLSAGTAVTLPFSKARETMFTELSTLAMYSGSASTLVAAPSTALGAYPKIGSFQVTNLRVVSPNTLVTENCYLGPLAWYFADTIQQWYTTWQTNVFQVHDTASGWYSGFVPASGSLAGILVFYQGQLTLSQVQQNLSNGQTPDIILSGKYGNAPTTNAIILSSDILACANTLNGGNVSSTAAAVSAAKNVCKMIAAAFNRGVMNHVLDDGSCPSSFYPPGAGAPPWNQWAQKVHSYNSSGLAYGFAYDDLCNQSTSIQSNPLQNCTISLGKFAS